MAQLASIRQMSGQVSLGSVAIIRQMSGQVSRDSAGEYQADEPAVVARLSWRTSLLFSAICEASSDNHFAFLHFFFLGMVLIPASCTMS